jgi:hypothetical protein
MLSKGRTGQLTRAFRSAIAAFVVLRVLLPGILMGVLSLGSAYMVRRLGGGSSPHGRLFFSLAPVIAKKKYKHVMLILTPSNPPVNTPEIVVGAMCNKTSLHVM